MFVHFKGQEEEIVKKRASKQKRPFETENEMKTGGMDHKKWLKH